MSDFTTLEDNSFEEEKTIVEGGESKLAVTDVNATQIFQDILLELKIMNIHLSSMTGMCVTDKEIN